MHFSIYNVSNPLNSRNRGIQIFIPIQGYSTNPLYVVKFIMQPKIHP